MPTYPELEVSAKVTYYPAEEFAPHDMDIDGKPGIGFLVWDYLVRVMSNDQIRELTDIIKAHLDKEAEEDAAERGDYLYEQRRGL